MPTMFLPYLVLVGLSCVGATPYARSVSASPRDGTCPAIWTQISSQLTSEFRGTDGQCTDLARAAIRFAFHDSGVSRSRCPIGGYLLMLVFRRLLFHTTKLCPSIWWRGWFSALEFYRDLRSENVPLQAYHDWLSGFYNKYLNQTSAADLIQFAASHAIVTCPGGPQVKTVGLNRRSRSTLLSTSRLSAEQIQLPQALKISYQCHSGQGLIMTPSSSCLKTKGSAPLTLPPWSAHTVPRKLLTRPRTGSLQAGPKILLPANGTTITTPKCTIHLRESTALSLISIFPTSLPSLASSLAALLGIKVY